MGSPKNINYLVLGVLTAVGALVWNTVVTAPSNFGQLSQQNAEIRTTMIEMKTSLTSLTTKFDDSQKVTSDQSARLSTLESQTANNREELEKLNARLSEAERSH